MIVCQCVEGAHAFLLLHLRPFTKSGYFVRTKFLMINKFTKNNVQYITKILNLITILTSQLPQASLNLSCKYLLQLPILHHLLHNIQSTLKLALDIQLRIRGPVGVCLPDMKTDP